MDVAVSIIAILIGLVLVLAGFRFARFALALWGFAAGMSIGGAIAGDLANTPFLGTTLGLTVGIVLGLVFALFSYLYYSLAVIILFGGLGYWVGSGFILLLGISPGVLSVTLGFLVGLLFGTVALVSNAPKYVLIAVTSFAGAIALIGGVLVLFDQIPVEAFSYATAKTAVTSSWWWSLTAIAITAFGIAVQSVSTADYTFEKWALNQGDINPPHTPTPHTPQHV